MGEARLSRLRPLTTRGSDQGGDEAAPAATGSGAQGLARATLIIVVFTALSRVLGFVREAVYAATFGASGELDAFLVAQGAPNIVITLISTAVVTASIPILAGYVGKGERERVRRTFSALFTIVLLALILASVVLALIAEQFVELTAPGFDEDQVELATKLVRILLGASAFVAAMNLVTGLLQAHREFFWPAIVGIPFNVVMIAAAVLFGGEFGVVALAVGFVLASAVRVAVQLPGMRKVGVRPALSLDWRDPGFRAVLVVAPLVLVGHSIANVNTFVDRFVGSTQVEGTISALSYGFRLVTLPHALLAMALVQALYPSLGIAQASDDRPRFRELMRRGLGTLGVVLVPITAALIVLRTPIVEVVFARGSFDSEDVALTSEAVAFYAIGLVVLGWRELVTRAFYAYQDARTPVAIAVLGMGVNAAGDLTLGREFGVAGLALSTSLSLAVTLVLLLWLLHRRLGLVPLAPVVSVAARALACGAVAAAAMHVSHSALRGALTSAGSPATGMEQVALLALPALAGGAVYLAALRIAAPRELREVRAALRSGIKRVRVRRERA